MTFGVLSGRAPSPVFGANLRKSKNEDPGLVRSRILGSNWVFFAKTLIPYLLIVPLWLGTLVGLTTDDWWWITYSPPFGDLAWVASWSTCVREVALVDAIRACEVGYPLPSVWIGAILGFSQATLFGVGTAMTLLWALFASLLIIKLTRLSGLAWGGITAFVLTAPTTWLLLQRGNLDQLTWVACLLGLYFMLKRENKVAVIFMSSAVLLKLFPVGLIAGFFPLLKNQRGRFFLLAAIPIAIALGLLYIGGGPMASLRHDSIGNSFAAFHPSYYLRVLYLKLQGFEIPTELVTVAIPPIFLDYITGVVLFFVGVTVLWAIFMRKLKALNSPAPAQWLLAGLGVVLASYLTGSNYDYRLVFLAFITAGMGLLSNSVTSAATRLWMILISSGLALSCWLSIGMPSQIQVIGDFVLWLSLAACTAFALKVLSLNLTVRNCAKKTEV